MRRNWCVDRRVTGRFKPTCHRKTSAADDPDPLQAFSLCRVNHDDMRTGSPETMNSCTGAVGGSSKPNTKNLGDDSEISYAPLRRKNAPTRDALITV